MESTTPLSAVLDVVPEVEHAFGYGSGVFGQPQASASDIGHADAVRRASGDAASAPTRGTPNAMVDYVFAVRSPLEWHAENMRRNPSHYAPHLRALGPAAVVAIADRVGVGVHFNTLVPWRGGADAGATLGPGHATHYKYGVVSLDTLCDDLTEWRSLFLAGRMQKPVAALGPDDARAAPARAAVAAARQLARRARCRTPDAPRDVFGGGAARRAVRPVLPRGRTHVARRRGQTQGGRHRRRIGGGDRRAVRARRRRGAGGERRTDTRGRAWDGRTRLGAGQEPGGRALPVSLAAPLGARRARGDGRSGSGAGRRGHGGGARRGAARPRPGAAPARRGHHAPFEPQADRLCRAGDVPGKAVAYVAAKVAKSAASRFRKPPR